MFLIIRVRTKPAEPMHGESAHGDRALCKKKQSSLKRYIILNQHIMSLQVGEHFMGRPGQTQRRSLEFQLHARPDAVLDPAPVLQEAGHVVQARCASCACTATQTRAHAL